MWYVNSAEPPRGGVLEVWRNGANGPYEPQKSPALG